MLAIQDYKLQMKFIPGKQNVLADALSRLRGHKKKDIENKALVAILLAQNIDKTLLKKIMKYRERLL